MNDDQIKDRLMSSSPEFHRLAEEHSNFERRLHDLHTHPHMTEQDLLEETTLKKKKLQVKDRMNSMIHRFRAELTHHAI
jgi:uncharacterized protein YdcH (DUF465 family)